MFLFYFSIKLFSFSEVLLGSEYPGGLRSRGTFVQTLIRAGGGVWNIQRRVEKWLIGYLCA